jgi:hypothetical protein
MLNCAHKPDEAELENSPANPIRGGPESEAEATEEEEGINEGCTVGSYIN